MTQTLRQKPAPNRTAYLSLFHQQARLSQARAYIDACYSSPLDLDQIARQACFSRFHFIRLFRKVYKRTPHQYLIQRRIEQAKVLLATSELSVTEVCLTVGFQSLGSFSLLFHKLAGQAPTDYRARIQDQRANPLRYIPNCFLFMAGIPHPLAKIDPTAS